MEIKFMESEKEWNKDVVRIQLVSHSETQILMDGGNNRVLAMGVKEPEKINARKLRILSRKIVQQCKSNKLKHIAIFFRDFLFPNLEMKARDVAETLAINFEMANYEFVKYKTPPKEGWDFVEEVIVVHEKDEEVRKGFEMGQLIGREVNDCRSTINTPGMEMTPQKMSELALQMFQGNPKVKVEILGKKEMEKKGMGGVLAVGKGSNHEPQFIILEYKNHRSDKPIVLVGKAVTYDTGGVCLKPPGSLLDMHMDKAGGAAVMHALNLASKLKIKKNVIGLIPCVENILSSSSYLVGDIVRTMSGKTVEVLNTDAEGRIILADALTYAKEYNPKVVLDAATLTGAAQMALGPRASALFTKEEKLEKLCRDLGEQSGDYLWPMPMWEEYEEEIKGTFGDIINVQRTSGTRYAGAILGAIFLYQFAKDYPWIHIDIAPRTTSIKGEYLAEGATGEPLRFLIQFLQSF